MDCEFLFVRTYLLVIWKHICEHACTIKTLEMHSKRHEESWALSSVYGMGRELFPLLAILYLIDKCKCDEIDASLHEYTEDLHTIWLNYLRKTTPKVFKTWKTINTTNKIAKHYYLHKQFILNWILAKSP